MLKKTITLKKQSALWPASTASYFILGVISLNSDEYKDTNDLGVRVTDDSLQLLLQPCILVLEVLIEHRLEADFLRDLVGVK